MPGTSSRRPSGWRRPPGPSTRPWPTQRGCAARPGRHRRATRAGGRRRVAAAKRAEGLLAQGEADAVAQGPGGRARWPASSASRPPPPRRPGRSRSTESCWPTSNRSEATGSMHRDLKRADAEYADVFRKAGLDLDTTGPEEAASGWRRGPTRSSWPATSTIGPSSGGRLGRPEADWRRLVAAARAGDPDPWRDALRAKFGSDDAESGRRVPAPGRRSQARGPARAGAPAAGAPAQVRLRRRRAGRPGLAASRSPLSGRLPHPCRAGPRPRRRAWRSAPASNDIFPKPEEAVRHLTAALGIRPGSVSTTSS